MSNAENIDNGDGIKNAVLSMLRLDSRVWTVTGMEVETGEVKLFSDSDPNEPIIEGKMDDIRNLNRGKVRIYVSMKRDLRHECPCCGRVMSVKERCKNWYRSSPVMGMDASIKVTVPKMECRHCHITPTMACPLVERGHGYTKLLKLDIMCMLSKETVTSTAAFYRVDPSVVYGILSDSLAYGRSRQDLSGVTTIFLDEIQSTHGQNYISIAADQDHRMIFGVIGHDMDSLRELREHLMRQGGDPDKVEYFSVDMSTAYRAGIERYFPRSEVILDTFHIEKQVNEAVDKVRKRTGKEMLKIDGYPRHIKYTVLYRERNHDENHCKRMALIRLFNRDLTVSFDLKEEFFRIFETNITKEGARLALLRWFIRCCNSGVDEMADVARRLMKRLTDILRIFDHRISNAVAEGMNNVYKKIKSAAFGFRNEQHLIDMCLFRKGNLDFRI